MFCSLDFYTGYYFELEGVNIKVKKDNDAEEHKKRKTGIILNISRNGDENAVALVAVLPVHPKAIIDKDFINFDYDCDALFGALYVSIEKPMLEEFPQATHIGKALHELAMESQRVLLLYKDTTIPCTEGDFTSASSEG